MNRALLSLAVGLSLSAACLAPAAAQYAPAGSYQQSCTNVRVRGDVLSASCTNPQGTRIRSTVSLASCGRGDITNSNGQLTCNPRGRYHNGGYNNGGYNNGGYNNGGYNNGNNGYNNGNNGGYNNGGYNNNGYGRGNGGVPNGSYQSSCQNIRSRGAMLSATCTAPNGGSMTSSINVAQCRGVDISNRNGRLSCP